MVYGKHVATLERMKLTKNIHPYPIVTQYRYRHRIRRTADLCVRNSAMGDFLVQQSYIIGKGMTLFVMFTVTMNWWYYRRTREDYEKKEDDKKNPPNM